jgi:hypothetical protein
MWPNKGEVDRRPVQGEAYRQIEAIAPYYPVVPHGSITALHKSSSSFFHLSGSFSSIFYVEIVT